MNSLKEGAKIYCEVVANRRQGIGGKFTTVPLRIISPGSAPDLVQKIWPLPLSFCQNTEFDADNVDGCCDLEDVGICPLQFCPSLLTRIWISVTAHGSPRFKLFIAFREKRWLANGPQ
jgi:hypothetical protein